VKIWEFKMQSAKCEVQSDGRSSNLQSVICNLQSAIPLSISLLVCSLLTAICSLASALPLYRDSLSNGLIVITFEEPRLPVVDIGFTCRSGSAAEPGDRGGLANLTVSLLNRGAAGMSGDSIASIIDFLGARYNAGAGLDQSGLSLRVLAKDWTQGLDLLTQVVRRPAFDAKEIEQARALQVAGLRRTFDNPGALVRHEFNRLLYAGHPYARSPQGDTLTTPSIRREDIVAFHQTHFVPNNCFVIAVGDIKRADFLAQVNAGFADWQPGTVPAFEVPELKYPDKLRVKLITRPEMNQTYVQFGSPGISITDPDMLAARLGAYALGGSALSSRLGIAVREKEGLAYDVRAVFDRNRYPGAFWASVQTARPREAIELMFREIQTIYDSGATQAELARAHNYYTGSFPLNYSSNEGKLESAVLIELHHLGYDWLDKFPERIRAVTLDDIRAALRRHLQPGRYIMVVMGNVTKDDLGFKDVEWID